MLESSAKGWKDGLIILEMEQNLSLNTQWVNVPQLYPGVVLRLNNQETTEELFGVCKLEERARLEASQRKVGHNQVEDEKTHLSGPCFFFRAGVEVYKYHSYLSNCISI